MVGNKLMQGPIDGPVEYRGMPNICLRVCVSDPSNYIHIFTFEGRNSIPLYEPMFHMCASMYAFKCVSSPTRRLVQTNDHRILTTALQGQLVPAHQLHLPVPLSVVMLPMRPWRLSAM
jgi:hypothetical protein